VIQSEKKPVYLEDRVDAFLDEMKARLETMDESEFEVHKSSLENKWLEADKNLSEEVSRYLVHVRSGHLDFFISTCPSLLNFATISHIKIK